MSETKYYDGTSLLNMKDLEGNTPSIFLATTNRSAGKTTFYLKVALETHKIKHKKFALIYRKQKELKASHSIFSDVMTYYPDLAGEMSSQPRADGLFYELFIDGESCGYSVSLHNPDDLKKYSPVFAEVDFLFMDEYQTESGKYLSDEFGRLQSILLSIARGGGKQSRNVTLVLAGNNVSIMNPYYIGFGIYKRLKKETKKLRGVGWAGEFDFNESASRSIKNNAIFKAFNSAGESKYMEYSTGANKYLIVSNTFMDKPKGKSKYICTIIHDGLQMGVRQFYEEGILHINTKTDKTCKYRITFKASDHNQNTKMINHYSFLWKNIRDAFNNGYLRFSDIKTKNAIFEILGVDLYK